MWRNVGSHRLGLGVEMRSKYFWNVSLSDSITDKYLFKNINFTWDGD